MISDIAKISDEAINVCSTTYLRTFTLHGERIGRGTKKFRQSSDANLERWHRLDQSYLVIFNIILW